MVTLAPRIGVLALQGDFEEHEVALRNVGAAPFQVRTEAQLATADSLIIPGGESTSMAKLMDAYALREPLIDFARSGKPVWGTCAGLIMLARELQEDRPEPLGVMDMVVSRNGFGRQVDSFETGLDITGVDGGPYHCVFIRAPKVVEVGPEVEVLASLGDGTIVAARQGHLMVTAFHPELTTDDRVHRMFAEISAEVTAR